MPATTTSTRTSLSITQLAVLGLLSYGPRSGYEIKQAAEASIAYVWTPARSHIYAVLPRLVAGGFATTRRVAQERRPDKQVYRITRKGEAAFHAWLEEPVAAGPGSRSPFLLKVFYGRKMSRDTLVAHVERRRDEAQRELAEYRELERRIRDDDASYYGYLTLRWGLAQCRAWIRWCDEVLADLAQRS